MADINKSLKDYLSKSSSSTSTNNEENGGTFSKAFSGRGWFSKSHDKSSVEANDPDNGWFTQAQKDPLLPSLTRKQRILGFITCLLMGTFCLSLASLYIPLLVLRARKFALLYTLGSLILIFSFSLLWGPVNHLKHLFSGARLPFSIAYFGTLFATLYFSMWVKSTVFTVIFAVIQVLALVWYIMSYIPGGNTGMKFFTKIFYTVASKSAKTVLPI